MEKTYYIATLVFAWFITVSLFVFSFFAFKLTYYFFGVLILLICIAATMVNILLFRNIKKQPQKE
ncbi:hypothetical protein [Lederbergia galactosidilytica]|nr:hypothetical protein [Lederbergia galactosidilytica]KRG12079.1 hypothetical protein ACA30_20805 [Virgibacillus soli]MBP1913547.1 Ca2+-dependent lipid-binding protein [Lederbergia galactosidilytica]OAK72138.1 hypothetical protein ABB05_08840 [Lederbergia galactosidilytica]